MYCILIAFNAFHSSLKVHTCGIGSICGEREKQFVNNCDWDPFNGACYNKHATCVLRRKDKGCEWNYPTDQKDCVFPTR